MNVKHLLQWLLINRFKKNQALSDQGFSMVEIMIVVLIAGILAAIAAPSWDAFTSRQRLRTVNNQVLQALKLAQAEAKRQKEDVKVEFTTGTTPTVKVDGQEIKLNLEGEVKDGQVKLATSPDSNITFDRLGSVTTDDLNSKVIVSLPDDKGKHCVIVSTLLGAMRTAEGDTECSP